MKLDFSSMFSRIKTRGKNFGAGSNNLNKKLLKQIKNTAMPSWAQFRYLPKFLSSNEKKVATAAISVFVCAVISWGIYAIISHSELLPKKGGEYSEAMIGQPKLINPLYASVNDVDADISSLIYSGLLKYDENKKISPDLAESYTIGADKKTYDFKLKKNLKWQDGEPITADDVLFTFEMAINGDVKSPLLLAFNGIRIEKLGEDSIRFTLKQPYSPFIDALTVGILPEHIWSEVAPSSFGIIKYNLQPIGSGPWKFWKMSKDESGNIQSYTLVPNENYYNKKPYLDTLTFKFFNNHSEAIMALKSQNVLGLSFIPQNLKEKVGEKGLNIFNIRLPQYTAIFFNQQANIILKNDDLRLALAHAIDKNKIIEKAIDGNGELIDAPILSDNIGYHPDIQRTQYNLNTSNELLDKTYPRLQPEEYFKIKKEELVKQYNVNLENSASSTASSTTEITEQQLDEMVRLDMANKQQFYRKTSKGEILKIVITTVDAPEYTKTAEEIAGMWRDIGIHTITKTINSKQIDRECLKNRNYEALIYGELVGADSDLFAFWHSSQTEYPMLNLARFSDRDADKLLEEARAEMNPDNRTKMYQKFQDILAKELPAIFLYSPTHLTAINKEIKGVDLNTLLHPYDRLKDSVNWYTKTSRQFK
jgi:peptide/nickel transport system substrate-binding protein